MAFTLHSQLGADTVEVTRLRLSDVRLMNDSGWPWLVLVPHRDELTELYELDPSDRRLLMDEIVLASTVLRDLYQAHKINVAALGNQVGQLHVHVIARHHHDPAWPRPIWNVDRRPPYTAHALATTVGALQDAFTRNAGPAGLGAEPEVVADAVDSPDSSNIWTFFGLGTR
jgi:diadenosine tetraphosphate (Ap4A) HIT family hydrolase